MASASAQAPGVKSQAASPGPFDGLIVKQWCGNLSKYISQITPSGVRIDSVKHEYYLISHAPDWKVYVVNNERKQVSIVSHYDWCTKYQLHQLTWVATLRRPMRTACTLVDGHKQITYFFGQTEHTTNVVATRSGLRDEDRESGPNHAEVVALDYPGAQMTGPIMMRLRGLPPLPGILLTARRYYGDPRKRNFNGAIDTSETLFNQKIPNSIFVLPRDYKIVPFSALMVETENLKNNTTDLINDLMLDRK
ncbi:MAG: hypothetical protein KGS72_24595 [Cyanobacteria bacterium REEB67]|nr:hypothetical protein [Cyanobacteria bacterium REEB67]